MWVPAAQQPNYPDSGVLETGDRESSSLPLGSVYPSTNTLTPQFHFTLVRAGVGPEEAGLAQLYLPRVHGEEEHDGEARQQAGVLDGKNDKEAAAARILLLTTHLVHLWKLRSRKKQRHLEFFKPL